MDEDDFDTRELSDLRSALYGKEYKKLVPKNTVSDFPQGFKDWVTENTSRQTGWDSTPYFIRDNFVNGNLADGLKYIAQTKSIKPVKTEEQKADIQKRWDERKELQRAQSELDLLASQITSIKLRASEYGSQTMALDNYIAKKDVQQIKRQIKLLESSFNDLDTQYANFIKNITQVIQDAKKYGLDVIGRLATPLTKRNWYSDPTTYESELDKLNKDIELRKNKSSLNEIFKTLEKSNVDYKEVSLLQKELTETEIISRVGGGDMTSGSCSSLAFTYAGNKCGFDVLDFRGGASRQKFSYSNTVIDISEKVGGIVVKHTNDFTKATDLLKQVQMEKEYYFACGSHVAIVRKTATGYEYLELQSATKNGFKPLTTAELKNRFGAKKSHTSYGAKYETKSCLIDINLLKNNPDFKKLLGYINTAKDKQKKVKMGQ